jgi:outer membrane protein assembly factor BamB
MAFDRAHHLAIGGGALYFGSSADCCVYALDAATGRERWSFFTDAPVRFAPCLWKDRVLVASDDGHLYCLAARDGKELWKKRGGPSDSMVLGNDRMVSRWPARGGPVVVDDIVYFAAGLWSAEGIFIYALDPRSGRTRWVNSASGNIVIEHPHGGNRSRSGVSAQGHLAVSEEHVFVPTGRGVPAAFGRKDGALKYFHLGKYGKNGGAGVMVAGGNLFNGGMVFDASTGKATLKARTFQPHLTAGYPGGVVNWHRGAVTGYTWEAPKGATRARNLKKSWSISTKYGGGAMMVADRLVISAGGPPGSVGVQALDLGTKSSVWSVKLEQEPAGLAVADGCLYVSTTDGAIHCFSVQERATPETVNPTGDRSPYGKNSLMARAAAEILRKTGGKASEGYCVDLACGDGALAYELATRTKMHVYAIEKNAARAAEARNKLTLAGLYGVRVTVHLGDPARTHYPSHFANIVVSGRSAASGSGPVLASEVNRLLRPYGGMAVLGKPGAMEVTTSGPLENAGEWTHQYADAAGTICSDDTILKGPLGMVWFTDFNFQMPSRHGRGPAPLFRNGVLIAGGVNGLIGIDAYNGRRIWEFPVQDILKWYDSEQLAGTAVTNSNMCIGGENIYLRTGGTCQVIDLQSGKKLKEIPIPGRTGVWGFIAFEDDTLFGTRANDKHVVRQLYRNVSDMRTLLSESTELFALDPETGAQRWSYNALDSIRHNAVVIGGGRVCLIDRPLEKQDLAGARKAPGGNGTLLCLDAKTGRECWKTAEDVYGTTLALSVKHQVLVMCYQYSQRSFQMPSEKGTRLTGFRFGTGKRMWDVREQRPYLCRPVVNDRLIYAQPNTYDLMTGRKRTGFMAPEAWRSDPTLGIRRPMSRQPGACGTISGGRNILLFRSGPLGYIDLLKNRGLQNYGPARPGCWINAIVSGGMVLMPDATDRCTCSYLIKASIGLRHRMPVGAGRD